MTPALTAALHVELRKLAASRVIRTTTVLVVAGITILSTALTSAARRGNEQVIAQLGPLADATGWTLLTGVAAQITAAGGLLAFGVALSWLVGREFSDATITGLFAQPVSRRAIVVAKLLSHLLWAVLVATALTTLIALVGTLLGLGAWHSDALGRQLVLTILSALVATPAAWAATLGRGPLPGIATTIGLIVVAQVAVVAGAGAWLPIAAPALWALQPHTVTPTQLALAAAIPASFTALTVTAWNRLQLNR
ncbi:ABC transporter permease [Micromonospora sp. WMMD1082]|uniref:ABC transporter permease n=1 Tax=Micromonospora sp. WMMD1082 TaxID=3016104 RepID=UPI002415F5B5|nr:ABC transporter permease [Micromonospora sp. WMMD1082]MDG4798446.1 ABC transporter permease [Micromonospora sp. WMMD1082]